MPCLAEIDPPGRLYRVARKPDPWRWPDWQFAHDDGTFGNRWDDPRRLYRQKAPRTLTRAISRHVYEHTTHDGHLFAGIFYESRHGNELHNYALFENGARWDFEGVSDRALSRHDPDLQQ